MRHSLRITLFSLTVGTLACIVPAHTQQPSSVLAGVRPSVALFDTDHDFSLNKTGFELSAYVGRSLGSSLAGVLEFSITTGTQHPLYYPCRSAGLCTTAAARPGRESAVSVAPGLQWIALTPAARVALTLAPGAVWFTNPATGARALAPRVSERLDVSQVIGAGPRIGFSIGAEWWGLRGSAPRWIVPLGVTLALR